MCIWVRMFFVVSNLFCWDREKDNSGIGRGRIYIFWVGRYVRVVDIIRKSSMRRSWGYIIRVLKVMVSFRF